MIIRQNIHDHLFNVDVIGFKKDKILVSANLKSIYYVSMNDFSEAELDDIKNGVLKSFLVFIHHIDPVINTSKSASYKIAKQEGLWKEILKLKEQQKRIFGKVIGITKGGYNVFLDLGINAFLPTSHLEVDVKNEDAYSKILNNSIELCIIGVNKLHRNIIVSRKEVVNQEIVDINKEKMDNLQIGTMLEGVIRGMYSSGIFVNIGSEYVGFVHLDEALFNVDISLHQIYVIGQKMKFKVLNIDDKNRKILLSINQCIENPIVNYKNNQVIDVIFYKINCYDQENKFVVFAINNDNLLFKLYSEDCMYSVNDVNELIESGALVKVVVKNVDLVNKCIYIFVKRSKKEIWSLFYSKYVKSNDKIFTFRIIGKSKYVLFLYNKGISTVLPINEVGVCNTHKKFASINIGDKVDVFVVLCDPETYSIVVTRRFFDFETTKANIELLKEKKIVECNMLYQIGLRIVVNVEGIFDVVIHSRKIGINTFNTLKEFKKVNLYFVIKNLDNLSVMLFDRQVSQKFSKKDVEKAISVQENTLADVSMEYAQLLDEINIAEGLEGQFTVNDEKIEENKNTTILSDESLSENNKNNNDVIKNHKEQLKETIDDAEKLIKDVSKNLCSKKDKSDTENN